MNTFPLVKTSYESNVCPLSALKTPSFSAPADLLQPAKATSSFIEAQKKILYRAQFDLFQKKLEKKYDPKVVKLLFEKLNEMGKKSLSQDDQKRFDVWCHYLDVEQRLIKLTYKKPSATHRLLKHILRYTQREVYYRMRHTYPKEPLTHENIEQCRKNFDDFIEMQTHLTEVFGEERCHRALTKVELYPSEVLLGLKPYPPLAEVQASIQSFYHEEITLSQLIDESTFEELNERAEEIKNRLHYIQNYQVAKTLFLELALKTGRTRWLKSSFPKSIIQQQAELFEASRLSHSWANTQKELIPLHESGGVQTQNTVYFLKGPQVEGSKHSPVAVFKEAKRAAAKEVLVYDIALLFGFQNAYVPTKLTHIQDKFGSLQTFQNGITWNDFYNLYMPPEEFIQVPPLKKPDPYPALEAKKPWQLGQKKGLADAFFNRHYAQKRKQEAHMPLQFFEFKQAYLNPIHRNLLPLSSKPWAIGQQDKLQAIVINRFFATQPSDLETFSKVDYKTLMTTYLKGKVKYIPTRTFQERFREFEDDFFNRISMEDYLKAGLGTLILGNRDLHTGNFFFVPKENGQYSIAMFDNEECLYPSNYVVRDDYGHCHLPARNALLIFPHADVILTGEMKKTLQNFIGGFEAKFNQFLDYLHSSKGKSLLEHFPRKEINHYSLLAFRKRIEKLIDLINSPNDFTYREIYYQIFPLYETYLSLVELIEPFYPEMLVGYHTAEDLCEIAMEKNMMTESEKEDILKYVRAHEFY